LVENFAWETEPGWAVHILNYTNPAAHRGWIREFFPIGEQNVRVRLSGNRVPTRVELLRAESDVPFQVNNGYIEFTVPKVVDYEIAAIYGG